MGKLFYYTILLLSLISVVGCASQVPFREDPTLDGINKDIQRFHFQQKRNQQTQIPDASKVETEQRMRYFADLEEKIQEDIEHFIHYGRLHQIEETKKEAQASVNRYFPRNKGWDSEREHVISFMYYVVNKEFMEFVERVEGLEDPDYASDYVDLRPAVISYNKHGQLLSYKEPCIFFMFNSEIVKLPIGLRAVNILSYPKNMWFIVDIYRQEKSFWENQAEEAMNKALEAMAASDTNETLRYCAKALYIYKVLHKNLIWESYEEEIARGYHQICKIFFKQGNMQEVEVHANLGLKFDEGKISLHVLRTLAAYEWFLVSNQGLAKTIAYASEGLKNLHAAPNLMK